MYLIRYLALITILSFLTGSAWAAGEADLTSKMSGDFEAGDLHYGLSNGYGTWNGVFLRGELHVDPINTWNAEIVNLREFGDQGTLFVIGNTHDFGPEWYTNTSVSSSNGGLFLPQLRLDAAINKKWLKRLNLITTAGIIAIKSKDVHVDNGLLLATSYYFEQPYILEGGIIFNHSNPGAVNSTAKYMALTYGAEKHRFLSLRYGFGEEAYQIVGGNNLLSDFNSNTLTATWRQWVQKDWGFQLRAESYHNPYYDRNGGEIGLFWDM